MNLMKTDSWVELSENTHNHHIRIGIEGSPFQEFDPTPAIQLQLTNATHCPNQREKKQWNARKSSKRQLLINDNGSSTEESSDNKEELHRENRQRQASINYKAQWTWVEKPE